MPTIHAAFTANTAPGVTRDQVHEALAELLEYLGTNLHDKDRSSTHSVCCWFDGAEIGVDVTRDVSWDFHELLIETAEAVAQLASDAFVVDLTNDDQMHERDTTWICGPTPAHVRDLEATLAFGQASEPIQKLIGKAPPGDVAVDWLDELQHLEHLAPAARDALAAHMSALGRSIRQLRCAAVDTVGETAAASAIRQRG